jgi:NAD(P)-dependent dehydrogenase (short-subunit alcohol dehydrogenase family)
MAEWSGQVAVVTGASRGIGRAVAVRLAAQGAAVCVNYAARADAAEDVVREILTRGGRAIAVQADVADAREVQVLIDRATAQLGPIGILVNNAGVIAHATLETFDRDAHARMRRINVDGVVNATRAVSRGMCERGYGRIVNIGSIAGIGTALPGSTFYAATKAEVLLLTRRFALELGRRGITVNAVAPGLVRTDMTAGALLERGSERERGFAEKTMVGRVGAPDDIANAVAFLASPESGWITAQVLTVDGGRTDYIGHA